jgi:hypothetical protein
VTHHSLIIFIDHHHVLYNILDHCWVLLSCARDEHRIKISIVRQNSKSSIWENMIVLKSFNTKTWSFWSLRRRKHFSLWKLRSHVTRHSLITHIDHHNHHVFYNIFDHRWVSFSRARNEHEIKTSNVRKNSKSSIWKNMIVLRSFNKRLDCLKVCTDHSMIRTRQTNAIRNETFKTNVRRLSKNFWLEKSPSTICSEWIREIVCDDLKLNDHYSLAFIVYRWCEKSL